MHLVPYLRVSPGEDQSIDSSGQLHALQKWAAAAGHTLAPPCQDENVSGALPPSQRPGLAAALEACRRGRRRRKGQPDGIVAWDRSRLCRDVNVCGYLAVLAQEGRFVLLTCDGYDSRDPSTEALFSNGLHGILNHAQRLAVGAATRKALAMRRETGKAWNHPPYGWRKAADGALEHEPREQALLTRMRALRAGGVTFETVAAELNEAGERNRAGGRWARGSVHRALTKPEPKDGK